MANWFFDPDSVVTPTGSASAPFNTAAGVTANVAENDTLYIRNTYYDCYGSGRAISFSTLSGVKVLQWPGQTQGVLTGRLAPISLSNSDGWVVHSGNVYKTVLTVGYAPTLSNGGISDVTYQWDSSSVGDRSCFLRPCDTSARSVGEDYTFFYDYGTRTLYVNLAGASPGTGEIHIVRGGRGASGAAGIAFSNCTGCTVDGLHINCIQPRSSSDGNGIIFNSNTTRNKARNNTIECCGDHHILSGSGGTNTGTQVIGNILSCNGKPIGDSPVVWYCTSGNVTDGYAYGNTVDLSLCQNPAGDPVKGEYRAYTNMTRAGSSTVTVTCTAHDLAVGTTIVVSGSATTALNGTYSIASTPTANTFTYVCGGSGTGTYTDATLNIGYSNGMWAFTAHVGTVGTNFIEDIEIRKCIVSVDPGSFQRTSAVDGFPNSAVCCGYEGRNTVQITGDMDEIESYPFRVYESEVQNGMLHTPGNGGGCSNAFQGCRIALSGASSAQALGIYAITEGAVGYFTGSHTRTLHRGCVITFNGAGASATTFIRLLRSATAVNNRAKWARCTFIYNGAAAASDSYFIDVGTVPDLSSGATSAVTGAKLLTNCFEFRDCVFYNASGTAHWKLLGGSYATSGFDINILNGIVPMTGCWIYGFATTGGYSDTYSYTFAKDAASWFTTTSTAASLNPGGRNDDPGINTTTGLPSPTGTLVTAAKTAAAPPYRGVNLRYGQHIGAYQFGSTRLLGRPAVGIN